MQDLVTLSVNAETQTVSARELHKKLNIEKRFSAWFETSSTGFVEGEDFRGAYLKVQGNQFGGTQELQDYYLTVDMAKHICLLSRTEKGKECRQYLIDLEKAWNTPEQIMARALKVAEQTISGLKVKVLEMKPKADFFDAVADSKAAVSMNEVARVLNVKGFGRNNLYQFLRERGILDDYNRPYQRYVDSGWFRLIEQHYTVNVEAKVSFKTLVYQRGVEAIRRMLQKGEPA